MTNQLNIGAKPFTSKQIERLETTVLRTDARAKLMNSVKKTSPVRREAEAAYSSAKARFDAALEANRLYDLRGGI
jgi:hypothetical protein